MEIITSYFKIILKKKYFQDAAGEATTSLVSSLAASTDAAGEDTSDVLGDEMKEREWM